MATTSITLNIDNVDLPTLRDELCNWAGLAPSNANAKQAIVIFIKKVHTDAARLAAQIQANAELAAAEATANAITIT